MYKLKEHFKLINILYCVIILDMYASRGGRSAFCDILLRLGFATERDRGRGGQKLPVLV